jgi:protein TonB
MSNAFKFSVTIMDDELIFEGRNQIYGAYALRKSYSDNMQKAMLIVFGIIVGAIAIGSIVSFKRLEPLEIELASRQINLDSDVIVERAKAIPIMHRTPKSPIAIEQIKYIEPTVVNDVSGKKDAGIATQNELKDKMGSSVTLSGVSGGAVIAVIEKGNGNEGVTFRSEVQEVEKPKVFDMASVSINPTFPGGDAALFRYLGENIKYPVLARENHIEGKCVLQFVVSKTGKIEDVKIIRTVDGGCAEEAIRVVNKMPHWKPGEIGGRPVAVKYTLPISFSLKR